MTQRPNIGTCINAACRLTDALNRYVECAHFPTNAQRNVAMRILRQAQLLQEEACTHLPKVEQKNCDPAPPTRSELAAEEKRKADEDAIVERKIAEITALAALEKLPVTPGPPLAFGATAATDLVAASCVASGTAYHGRGPDTYDDDGTPIWFEDDPEDPPEMPDDWKPSTEAAE